MTRAVATAFALFLSFVVGSITLSAFVNGGAGWAVVGFLAGAIAAAATFTAVKDGPRALVGLLRARR